MDCQQAADLLSEYLDERMHPQECSTLEAHLAGCSSCRTQADRMAELHRHFSSMPQIEPPIGFRTRVMAQIGEEGAKPKLWNWLLLPSWFTVPVQGTAVVLIAVLAVLLYRQERPLEQLPATVPQRSTETRPPSDATVGEPQTPSIDRQAERLSESIPAPSDQPYRSLLAPKSGSESSHTPPAPAHYRLTLRVHTSESGKKGAADSKILTSLTDEQTRRLDQARRRVLATEQPREELFSVPRENYAALKKELARIGTIDAEMKALAETSDPLLVAVTLVPPSPGKLR